MLAEGQADCRREMPARMDLFARFILFFILTYAATSLILEHVFGIIGFSKAPYLNAVAYLYTVAFLGFGFLYDCVTPRVFAPHPFAILILAALLASAVIGIANQNPVPYIVAWSFYVTVGVITFQFFRNLRELPRGIDGLFSLPVMAVVLAAAILSIFNRENHYQYVLFEVIAIYAVLIRPRILEKLFGLAIYIAMHLGSNEGFVQVEINRASILAIGTVGLIFLLYRRWIVVLFFVTFAALGALSYALSLDDAVVEDLPRNVKEAILLMKGDDIYRHTSSYQRIYEGEKVMEDFEGATNAELLFGKGLGRTVDMTGAGDKTPGQHALLGAQAVHNIHFLHFAVLHKFGIAGLAILAALGLTLAGMFVTDLSRRRLTDGSMFFYFYLIYNFVFATPASNFLIANPLWPAFFGLLCRLRHEARVARVSTVGPATLTATIASGR
jgi:hypothetical protein